MAKKKEVVITCNATNVKAVIEGLERGMAALAKEEEKLLNVIKQRGYAENDEKKRLKELEKAMDAMRTNVQKNREEQKKLAEVMKDLAGAKLKDLKRALQEGKAALNNMSAKDPGRAQLVHDLQRIQKQIEINTGALKSHGSAWQSAVKNITAYVGVFGAFNFIKNKITEVIRGGEELSDQMAQVRMVSGLAMEDIEDLTRTLAKMDTRTTLSELERIAYAGAKLGFGEYGTKGLEEFVRAANQVNVALREDLGEEALTALSKITENMGLIKKMGVEDAMLATSSAMFKLAATSTAAAGPIVEVTKRLVPVAQASGMATHEILALASASDSLQLMPEVVGTALSKLLMAMQNNHNLIEQTLGIDEGTIARMIKAGDVMDAMLMIFDKMSGKNMTELSGIWKLLGSDGQRLITVVQAMANHTDTLRKHLETSTQAFKEATAVTEEYNIQQETAAALMQRASNLWRNAMVNADTSLSVKEMAKSWYDFSKSVLDSEFSLSAIKVTIDALLGSIRLLINLLPMIAFGLMAKGAAMLAVKLSTAKMAVDGFTLSWKKMDAATKANWISLAIGLFAQLAFSVAQWAKSNEEAEASQRKLNRALDSAAEKAEQEINAMSRLKAQVEDTSLSQEERMKMFSKFKTDYDIYLNYLGIELNSVDELAKHYDALTKVMRQRFAYQEREDYKRDVMGGEDGLRMRRRTAGSDLTRIANDINRKVDLSVIDSYVASGVTPSEISQKILGKRPNVQTSIPTDKLRDAIVNYAQARLDETLKEKQIDAAFAQEIGDFDYDKWLRTQVKGDFKLKPDKEALKAAKKAAQDRKKALKLEMDEAQKASTGIISKLEEYYRLQEAAINDARADGQLTEEQAKEMVRSLSILKNESLATARRAVTTGDTKNWDELKTKVLPAVLADTSDVSKNLLSTIQKVAVDKLHADLEKFNGSSDVLGLDSRAFFDQMNAKAAGNTREAARLRAKIQNEIEKALLQYQFVEKANLQMRKDLETIGITTETYEQWAKRMQQGITEKPAVQLGMRTEQREQMYRSFEAYGEQTKGPKDAEGQYSTADKDVVQWVQQWSQQADNAWMKGLPQLDEWLSDTDKYEKQIADFYRTLLSMYEGYKKQMQQSENEGADFLTFTQGQQQVSDATAQLDKMLGRSITDKEAYREMGNKFVDMGVINFRYNIENQQEAEQWLNDFATTSAGELEDWAQAFPELVAWIDLIKRKEQGETLGDTERQALENAMPAIRNLFNEMMRHADRLDKAMKDAFQHEKETQESRFRVSGYKDEETKIDKYYTNKAKQEQTGAGQTFVQQLGLGSIANDPEILQIQNRIYWRNKEVEDARARLDEMKAMQQERIDMLRENGATEDEIHAVEMQNQQDRAGLEQLLTDRQAALTEQTTALTTKTMQQLQKRVTAVQNLTKPFSDAAKNIGQKFGEMIRGAEEDSMTWEEIWHNMLLAVGESVIQMGAQYAQNLIMQQAMNRASEAETAAHTTAEVTAGIAAGSAKTIGTLGWWGIPLVAVISALLMGLLQGALGTNRSSKSSETSTKAATSAPKTKLVSGMLTYDQGNVDKFAGRRKLYDDGTTQVYSRKHHYLGNDGKVYTATEEPAPKDGLVTHPIATTVQGQPAVVAEKGPEIVIGRETTANIMRNAPELLQAIVDIDRNPHKKPDALPMYDKGNVSEVAGEAKAAENSEKVQEVTMRVNRDNRYHTERQDERNNEEQSVAMSEESLQRMMEQFRKTRSDHEATDKRLRQQEDSRKESMRRDSVTTDAKDSTESLTRWFRDFATAEMTTQYVTLGEWAKAPESHIGEIKQLYKVLSSHDEQTRRSDQQAIERTMDTINNVKDITSVKAESENTVVSEEALSKMTAKFRTIEEQRRLDTNDTAAVTRWLNDFVTTDVTSMEDVRSQKEDVTKKSDVSSKKSDIQDTLTVSRQTSDIKNREVREQFVKSMPAVEQWQTEPEKHVREIIQLYNTLATHDEQMRRSEQEHAERSIATVNDVMSIIGMKTDATSTDRQQSVKITEDIATEMVRKHRQVEEQRSQREEQEQKRVKDATSWLRDFVTTDVTSLEDVRSQKEDVTKKLDVSSKKSDVQDTSTVSHQTSDIKNSEVRESFTKAMPHVDEWLKEPEKHVEEIMQLRSMLTRYDEQLQRSEVENAEHNEVDSKQRIARSISDNIDRNETAAFSNEVLNQMVSKHRSINEQRRLHEEQEQKRSSVDERSRSDIQEVRQTLDKGNVEEVTKRRRLDTSNTEEMTRWLNDFVTTDVTSLEDVRSQKEDITKKSAVSSKKSDIQDTLTVSRQTSDIKNSEVRESFTKAMPHVDEWLQEPEKHQQEIAKLYTTLTDIDERERISREESNRMDNRRTDSTTVRRDSVTTDKNIALTEQYYKGEDGRTYKAQPGAVPEGVTLLTKPIATMINGESAVVAEKGPELVIGRETTKAMQLNRPDLLRAIVSFDKNKTQQSMRMFDQGNIQSIGEDTPETPVSDANEERQALRQQMAQMREVMDSVLYFLQNPVAPEIAMYDTGGKKGLRSKMKEADRFMSRYDG